MASSLPKRPGHFETRSPHIIKRQRITLDENVDEGTESDRQRQVDFGHLLINFRKSGPNGEYELLRQVSSAGYLISRYPINNRLGSAALDYDRLYHDLRVHAPSPNDSITLECSIVPKELKDADIDNIGAEALYQYGFEVRDKDELSVLVSRFDSLPIRAWKTHSYPPMLDFIIRSPSSMPPICTELEQPASSAPPRPSTPAASDERIKVEQTNEPCISQDGGSDPKTQPARQLSPVETEPGKSNLVIAATHEASICSETQADDAVDDGLTPSYSMELYNSDKGEGHANDQAIDSSDNGNGSQATSINDDGGYGDQVIIISDGDSDSDRSGQETYISGDDEYDFDDEDTVAGVTALASSLAPSGGGSDWIKACTFFRHPASYTSYDQGKKLWGTTIPTRPDQLQFVYIMLNRMYQNSRFGGSVLAVPTGGGKTIMSLCVAAVLRTLELNARLIKQNALKCGAIGSQDDCPSDHPFGLQCPCVRNSLSASIVTALVAGPTLAFTPSCATIQFARKAKEYLKPSEHLACLNRDIKFIEVFNAHTHWAFMPAEMRKRIMLSTFKAGSPPILQRSKSGGTERYILSGDSRLCYTPQQIEYQLENDTLVVASCDSNSLSKASSFRKMMQFVAPLSVKNTKRQRPQVFDWAIRPRLVVADEMHINMREETIFWTMLRTMRDSNRPFKLLGMSGTPIGNSLFNSFRGPIGFILSEADAKQFLEHAKTIDKYTSNREDRRSDSQNIAMGKARKFCLDVLKVVMINSDGKFQGKDTYPAVPFHRQELECSSPRAASEGFQRELEALRSHLRDNVGREGPDILTQRCLKGLNQIFNRALYCNQFPGILDLPPARKEDTASWLNGNVVPKHGHELLGYFSGDKDINTITEGCAKLEQVRSILDMAAKDDSLDVHHPSNMCIKKHTVIFCAAPGEAAIVAAYLMKVYQEDQLIIRYVRTGTEKNFIREMDLALADIPFHDPHSPPTVIVSTTGVLSTAIDCLSKCSYGIVFRVPVHRNHVTQAEGRLRRFGARFEVKWFVLHGVDGPCEKLISARNSQRTKVFTEFLSAHH